MDRRVDSSCESKKSLKGVETMDYSISGSIYGKRIPKNGKVKYLSTMPSIWIRPYHSTKLISLRSNLKKRITPTGVLTRPSALTATKISAKRASSVLRPRRQVPRLRISANTTRHRLSGLWTLMGSLWNSTLTRSYRNQLFKKRVWNSLTSCRGLHRNRIGGAGLGLL